MALYTEKVMDAARQAGAAGGTVVHAKGTGAKYAKFFGLTLADEKEMIYIVSFQGRNWNNFFKFTLIFILINQCQ